MKKLKCWKKQWDHTKSYGNLVYKHKDKDDYVSIYPTSKKDIWVDAQEDGKRKIIATTFSLKSAKDKARSYMKAHNKC